MARLTDREIDLIQRSRVPFIGAQDEFSSQDVAAHKALTGMDQGQKGWLSLGADLAALLRYAKVKLFGPLMDHLHYRRTVAELEALDDHQLADIGLYRGAIEGIAQRSQAAQVKPEVEVPGIILRLQYLVMWTSAVRQLQSLNDRMLEDIGINRADIQHHAALLISRRLGMATPARRAQTQRSFSLSRWLERRRTVKELSGLNDRMLEDIGLDRNNLARSVDRYLDRVHAEKVRKSKIPHSTRQVMAELQRKALQDLETISKEAAFQRAA